MGDSRCGGWRLPAVALAALVVLVTGCGALPPIVDVIAPSKEEQAALALMVEAERQLDSPDAGVRRQAAVALLSMNRSRALDAVLNKMRKAEDPAVRASMIEAAAFTGEHRCFADVLAGINDRDASVREAAAKALSRFSRDEEIGPIVELAEAPATTAEQKVLLFQAVEAGLFLQATPVLLKALDGDNAEVMDAAWKALRAISGLDLSPEPGPWRQWWEARRNWSRQDILEERLRDLQVRLKVGADRARELEAELEEFSSLVCSPAAQTPERLLRALSSKYRRVREFAAFRLASLGAEQHAAVSLADRATHDVLRAALSDESPAVRQNIVQLLADLKGEARAPLVMQALQDNDAGVLAKAVEAVDKDMGEPAAKRLAELLKNPHSQVREAAAIALGKVGTDVAPAALIEALQDKEENVRWFAVESLRKLNVAQAVPQLVGVLENDSSPRVREITAGALETLAQPAAIPALRKALKDQNERVRARAAGALQALARGDFDRSMAVADALADGGFSDAAIDLLRKTLADFAQQADLQKRLVEARRRLADLLKAKGDFAAAAPLFGDLLKTAPDAGDLRAAVVECWVKAGEPGRVTELVKAWLQNSAQGELAKLVDVGCDLARMLNEAKQERAAGDLLAVLLKAARDANAPDLVEKVRALMPAQPAPPPAEEKAPAEPKKESP